MNNGHACQAILVAGLLAGVACNSPPENTVLCDEACLRTRLGIPERAERVIVFSQSAHLDWDWMMTFEDYYQRYVESIFSAAHGLMKADPRYFYSICEVDFLERHLLAHPEQKADLVSWIRSGQLRIVGGGMSSPGTLLPAGESILRDYYYGQQKLSQIMGAEELASRRPVSAWLPDNFGHSPTVPSLLRAAGYRHVAFARLPGADTTMHNLGFKKPRPESLAAKLIRNARLDFIWRAPDGSEVLAHYMYPNYGVGDSLDNGISLPGMPGYDLNGKNTTASYVNGEIKRYIKTIGAASPTDYIFVPVGNDFQLPKPLLLSHLDRWNRTEYPKTGVWAVAATFEHYARLVEFQRDMLVTMEMDGTPYWTGFYATKPELKLLHQRAEFLIRSAESFRLLAPGAVSQKQIGSLWKQLVPSNHHDYLPGTSPDKVYQSEQLPLLQKAATAAEKTLATVEAVVTSTIDTSGKGTPVVVFNHFGLARGGPVEVKGVEAAGTDLVALDPGGSQVDVQVLSRTGDRADVLFLTDEVPAHGYQVFHLRSGNPSKAAVSAKAQSDGRVLLSNSVVELLVGQRGIDSLKIAGQQMLATGGRANELVFYFDDGGLYRLGGELLARGCTYQEKDLGEKFTAAPRILESGPLRARVLVSSTVAGHKFSREVSLVSGERMVRFQTTGTAPEHYTVTARFDLKSKFSSAEMGAPYGLVERDLNGPWPELYHPAQVFFAPLDAGGAATAAFTTDGSLAWKAEPSGRVEHIVLRDARVEKCDSYGPSAMDNVPHTMAYAVYFPRKPGSTRSRSLPGRLFGHPLRAIAVKSHSGSLPPKAGILRSLDDGAYIHAAAAGEAATAGLVMARVHRVDRDTRRVLLRPGRISFTRAYLGDLFFRKGKELRVNDGTVEVPLAHDVVTVLLE